MNENNNEIMDENIKVPDRDQVSKISLSTYLAIISLFIAVVLMAIMIIFQILKSAF